MSTILQSLAPVPIEVTFDSPSLPVAMQVYKWAGSFWTAVGSPQAASNLFGSNTYASLFTPGASATPYICVTSVYTDDSFATLNTGYLSSSQSFYVDPNFVTATNSLANSATAIAASEASLATDLATFGTQLTTLENINLELEGSVTSITTATEALTTVAAAIESASASISASASDLASTETALASTASEIASQLTTLSSEVSTLSGYLTTLGADITEINAIITSLESLAASLVSISVPPSISAQVLPNPIIFGIVSDEEVFL